MPRTVTGPIYYPDGSPIRAATLRLTTTRNSYSADGSVPIWTQITIPVDPAGALRANINLGEYRVELQEALQSTWLAIGRVQVEAGGAIELGELIEFSGSDLDTTYPDVATRAWVQTQDPGGTPSSIAITGLDPGSAAAKTYITVNDAGTAIIGLPHRELDYFFGNIASHVSHRILIP